jgi:hypothetical protein
VYCSCYSNTRGVTLDQGEPVGGGWGDGSSAQWHLHSGGARLVGKQWRWTGGWVEVLGELFDK